MTYIQFLIICKQMVKIFTQFQYGSTFDKNNVKYLTKNAKEVNLPTMFTYVFLLLFLGASDDGAGCAVMLEILRVMSKTAKIFRHNIIFLFNGGEENFMPASHGFITQHKWANEVNHDLLEIQFRSLPRTN